MSADGVDVTLRAELNALAPRLRRYARALVAGDPEPSDEADELVKKVITDALTKVYPETGRELLLRLLAALTLQSRELVRTRALIPFPWSPRIVTDVDGPSSFPAFNNSNQSKLARGLLALPVEQREALLLVTLERCDYGEAARILRLSRATLIHRLTQARSALDNAFQARPVPPAALRRAASHLRVVS